MREDLLRRNHAAHGGREAPGFTLILHQGVVLRTRVFASWHFPAKLLVSSFSLHLYSSHPSSFIIRHSSLITLFTAYSLYPFSYLRLEKQPPHPDHAAINRIVSEPHAIQRFLH